MRRCLEQGRRPNETITVEQLGPPLMEVVVNAGEILYVPRGMIHATSTSEGDAADTSVALTVGLPQFRSGFYSTSYDALLGIPTLDTAVW